MLEIIERNENITEKVNSLLESGTGDLMFCPDNIMAHIGSNLDYNKEYCDDNNIFTLFIPRIGGTIVCSNEDVDYFSVFRGSDEKNRGPKFLDFLADWLHSIGLCAITSDGNDIIVDGYKIAAYGCGELSDGRYVTGIHISVKIDADLISHICTKEMIKMPKGLSDFGITKEKIKEIMQIYFLDPTKFDNTNNF